MFANKTSRRVLKNKKPARLAPQLNTSFLPGGTRTRRGRTSFKVLSTARAPVTRSLAIQEQDQHVRGNSMSDAHTASVKSYLAQSVLGARCIRPLQQTAE